MAAAAIIKNSKWSSEVIIPAPMLDNGNWLNRPNNQRTITIKENFDEQNIVKDFYKTVNQFVHASVGLKKNSFMGFKISFNNFLIVFFYAAILRFSGKLAV